MAASFAEFGINPDRIYEEHDPCWFMFTKAWMEVVIERQEESKE